MIKFFGSVGITPSVYEELLTPLEHGYEYPKEIFEKSNLLEKGLIQKQSFLN